MTNRKTKYSLMMKPQKTAILILAFFTFQQVIPQQSFAQTAAPVHPVLLNQSQIEIPQQSGLLEDVVVPTQPRGEIVHIQTAHGSFEAQKNIQSIIESLSKQGFKTLFLEGGSGEIHPEVMRFFPAKKDWNGEFVDELAKRGNLTGAELFMIDASYAKKSKSGPRAFGIEDTGAYFKNRKDFQTVLRAREKSRDFLTDLDIQIERFSAPYLNPELKTHLKTAEAFETKRVDLKAWLNYLSGKAKDELKIDLKTPHFQSQWPMLTRYFRLEEAGQKLSMEEFENEKKAFVLEVKSRGVSEEQIKPFETVFTQETFKAGQVTPLLYVTALNTLGGILTKLPGNFDFKPYENVKRFAQLMIFQSELRGGQLFDEMSRLNAGIENVLAKNNEEKLLLARLKDYQLLKKLFSLELPGQSFEEINQRREALKPSALVEGFKAFNQEKRVAAIEFGHLKEMDGLYALAVSFYEGALKRDHLMAENVLEILRTRKESKVIVVTGGFHARGIKQFFESKNFSYYLVTPNMTQDVDMSNYYRLMLDGESIRNSKIENWLATLSPAMRSLAGSTVLNSDVKQVLRNVEPARRSSLNPKVLGLYGISLPSVSDRSAANRVAADFIRSEVRTNNSSEPSSDTLIYIQRQFLLQLVKWVKVDKFSNKQRFFKVMVAADFLTNPFLAVFLSLAAYGFNFALGAIFLYLGISTALNYLIGVNNERIIKNIVTQINDTYPEIKNDLLSPRPWVSKLVTKWQWFKIGLQKGSKRDLDSLAHEKLDQLGREMFNIILPTRSIKELGFALAYQSILEIIFKETFYGPDMPSEDKLKNYFSLVESVIPGLRARSETRAQEVTASKEGPKWKITIGDSILETEYQETQIESNLPGFLNALPEFLSKYGIESVRQTRKQGLILLVTAANGSSVELDYYDSPADLKSKLEEILSSPAGQTAGEPEMPVEYGNARSEVREIITSQGFLSIAIGVIVSASIYVGYRIATGSQSGRKPLETQLENIDLKFNEAIGLARERNNMAYMVKNRDAVASYYKSLSDLRFQFAGIVSNVEGKTAGFQTETDIHKILKTFRESFKSKVREMEDPNRHSRMDFDWDLDSSSIDTSIHLVFGEVSGSFREVVFMLDDAIETLNSELRSEVRMNEAEDNFDVQAVDLNEEYTRLLSEIEQQSAKMKMANWLYSQTEHGQEGYQELLKIKDRGLELSGDFTEYVGKATTFLQFYESRTGLLNEQQVGTLETIVEQLHRVMSPDFNPSNALHKLMDQIEAIQETKWKVIKYRKIIASAIFIFSLSLPVQLVIALKTGIIPLWMIVIETIVFYAGYFYSQWLEKNKDAMSFRFMTPAQKLDAVTDISHGLIAYLDSQEDAEELVSALRGALDIADETYGASKHPAMITLEKIAQHLTVSKEDLTGYVKTNFPNLNIPVKNLFTFLPAVAPLERSEARAIKTDGPKNQIEAFQRVWEVYLKDAEKRTALLAEFMRLKTSLRSRMESQKTEQDVPMDMTLENMIRLLKSNYAQNALPEQVGSKLRRFQLDVVNGWEALQTVFLTDDNDPEVHSYRLIYDFLTLLSIYKVDYSPEEEKIMTAVGLIIQAISLVKRFPKATTERDFLGENRAKAKRILTQDSKAKPGINQAAIRFQLNLSNARREALNFDLHENAELAIPEALLELIKGPESREIQEKMETLLKGPLTVEAVLHRFYPALFPPVAVLDEDGDLSRTIPVEKLRSATETLKNPAKSEVRGGVLLSRGQTVILRWKKGFPIFVGRAGQMGFRVDSTENSLRFEIIKNSFMLQEYSLTAEPRYFSSGTGTPPSLFALDAKITQLEKSGYFLIENQSDTPLTYEGLLPLDEEIIRQNLAVLHATFTPLPSKGKMDDLAEQKVKAEQITYPEAYQQLYFDAIKNSPRFKLREGIPDKWTFVISVDKNGKIIPVKPMEWIDDPQNLGELLFVDRRLVDPSIVSIAVIEEARTGWLSLQPKDKTRLMASSLYEEKGITFAGGTALEHIQEAINRFHVETFGASWNVWPTPEAHKTDWKPADDFFRKQLSDKVTRLWHHAGKIEIIGKNELKELVENIAAQKDLLEKENLEEQVLSSLRKILPDIKDIVLQVAVNNAISKISVIEADKKRAVRQNRPAGSERPKIVDVSARRAQIVKILDEATEPIDRKELTRRLNLVEGYEDVPLSTVSNDTQGLIHEKLLVRPRRSEARQNQTTQKTKLQTFSPSVLEVLRGFFDGILPLTFADALPLLPVNVLTDETDNTAKALSSIGIKTPAEAYVFTPEFAITEGGLAVARKAFGNVPIVVIAETDSQKEVIKQFNLTEQKSGKTPFIIAGKVGDAVRHLSGKRAVGVRALDDTISAVSLKEQLSDVVTVTPKQLHKLIEITGAEAMVEKFKALVAFAQSA